MSKVMEAAIDPIELSVRIAESCMGVRRPQGMSAADAFKEMQRRDPESAKGFNRAAVRAAEYIVECINTSGNFAEMN